MEKGFDKERGSATYRSRDPIKNLTIRVTLKRVSASTLAFDQSSPEGQQDVAPTTINQFDQTVLEKETLNVHWQQKFFSQREIEFYGFEPNCKSVVDYKYHAEVEKIKNLQNRSNMRLFTYLGHDRFSVAENDIYTPITTSKDEVPSQLYNRIMEVRRRRVNTELGALTSWDLNKGRNATGLKLIESQPTDEFKDNHHIIGTPTHTFILMADLGPDSQLGNVEYEYPLCTLEYDDNGVLRVTPDFSSTPLRITDVGLTRDIWEYTVEHSSSAVSKMETRREAKMVSELYRKHQSYLQGLVGDEFEELPNNLFRLLTYGEILSAESFEYDDLHVEYFLDLPSSWKSDPAQLLSGCTHSCKTTLSKNIEKAYFAHPFDYQMYLDLSDDETLFQWPKMFLHVISCDTWGRRRTEGYGYFNLPTQPGFHEVCVQCWRPTGDAGYTSVLAQMRRYFIGGNPELEDVTYTAVPNTFEGKILSKYGVRCCTSGCVRVRLNCLQQCQGFKDETTTMISKKKWQSALQVAKGRASEKAIHGIMDAYQRARKRMLLARENVPSQIRLTAEKNTEEKMKKMSLSDKVQQMIDKSKME